MFCQIAYYEISEKLIFSSFLRKQESRKILKYWTYVCTIITIFIFLSTFSEISIIA